MTDKIQTILEALEQYHRLQVPAGQTNPEHPAEKALAALSSLATENEMLHDKNDGNSQATIGMMQYQHKLLGEIIDLKSQQDCLADLLRDFIDQHDRGTTSLNLVFRAREALKKVQS